MSIPAPKLPSDDGATGLPLFRTWPRLYGAVLTGFGLVVLALAIFTRLFAR